MTTEHTIITSTHLDDGLKVYGLVGLVLGDFEHETPVGALPGRRVLHRKRLVTCVVRPICKQK